MATSSSRCSRTSAAKASRLRTRSSAEISPRNTSRPARRGSKRRCSTAWSAVIEVIDAQCRYRRRLVSRRRFERNGVQTCRDFCGERRFQESEADPARADHEGRECDSGGISGRHHGRFAIAAAARSAASKSKGNLTMVQAEVPLAEMFGYATAIRSLSKGRSSYSMEPSHFEQVPAAARRGRS